MERYIVFDVETPNSANDRISSIGVVVVEGQSIVREFYTLVNPETHFDAFNISLTGISPEDVADKPTFAEAWADLAPIFSSGMLIAHNAPFDMSVLAKCLNAYQIEWQPYAYYACTCQMGRKCFPHAQNHKLNTLCTMLHIPLEQHHCALDDAKACAGLLIHYLKQGCDPTDYVRSYDIANTCTEKRASGMRRAQPSETTLRLQTLQMILKSISADGVLTSEEVMVLERWMTENQELEGNYPFDKVFRTVRQATQDGILDAREKEELLDLFTRITDPVGQTECGCFDIRGKVFCLTGEFKAGGRSQVEAYFVAQGGIAGKSVTKKTGYLIVGELGSDMWSSGNYGSKVKKAMELQEKGSSIVIVKEGEASITL
ncbi:MAG: 3'-5' exoribonuclease [Clostridia bacterium]|nr:3'-5' exoribonuclease [Clostridia bacterium]